MRDPAFQVADLILTPFLYREVRVLQGKKRCDFNCKTENLLRDSATVVRNVSFYSSNARERDCQYP
jgi:hypothetical protein